MPSCLRARQVGVDALARPAAAARLRGAGTGALERKARTVPRGGGGHQPARRELHDVRAVLPPPETPGGPAAADPLPLVVLTPKSLLRHPMVASRPRDLAEGRWQPVLRTRGARARARRAPCHPLQRQGVRGSRLERVPRPAPGHRDLPHGAALPLPGETCNPCSTLSRTATRSYGCRKSRRTWARGNSCARCSKRSSTAGVRCATSAAHGVRARRKAP